jgi:hypothetical protein
LCLKIAIEKYFLSEAIMAKMSHCAPIHSLVKYSGDVMST